MAGLVSDKEDNKALRKPEKVCSEIMTRQRQLSETDAELCQGHHGAAGDAISSSKTAFFFFIFIFCYLTAFALYSLHHGYAIFLLSL